ncbi:MAG: hypothetical protein LBQ43_05485 [Holosporales bacterium]|jgi:hypothetical protein|nr:hypothetical protein [Holosporales bacterium]
MSFYLNFAAVFVIASCCNASGQFSVTDNGNFSAQCGNDQQHPTMTSLPEQTAVYSLWYQTEEEDDEGQENAQSFLGVFTKDPAIIGAELPRPPSPFVPAPEGEFFFAQGGFQHVTYASSPCFLGVFNEDPAVIGVSLPRPRAPR